MKKNILGALIIIHMKKYHIKNYLNISTFVCSIIYLKYNGSLSYLHAFGMRLLCKLSVYINTTILNFSQ